MLQDRKRVVWFEGMTLDPHHFQQWDRYHLGVLNARVGSAVRFDWGLTRMDINRDRLANGEFVVERGSGVMPDGYVFDMPDSDPVPPPRNVQDAFPATDELLTVFLALPAERQGGGNVLLQNGEARRETRYRTETLNVYDENTGVDDRPVEVGRANFQIRFGREAMQEYTAIQIAEVKRDTSGVFILSETFVPTCLGLVASERLMTITRTLIERMVTRSGTLMDRHRSVLMQRELSPADMTALGLLSTLNTYIPVLNHHHAQGGSHPEALYLTLLALGGQLTAFLPDAGVHPRDFPVYDHAQLTACFNEMDRLLLQMLGGAKPKSNYVELPLQQVRENLYHAAADPALLQNSQFFLIARSGDVPEQMLVNNLPMMLRIASPDTIDAVLRSYTRALTVEHTHRLPSGMPVDQQANYFELQKRGPFWESVTDSGTFAVFVPTEFSSVNLSLIAVQAPR